MDKVLFEIKNFIYVTIMLVKDFFRGTNLLTVLAVLIILYAFFFRRWLFKKTCSFFLTIGLIFVFYLHINNFFARLLTPENASIPLGILQTVAGIVFIMVFLYYATVKE